MTPNPGHEDIAVFTTRSAEETFELAYSIAEKLTSSTIMLLKGDLGAGKTVFAKGIAAGLDIDPADVTSPTFTIVNEYEGRMKLYHLDLYRLEGVLGETESLGLGEMMSSSDAVVLIEWPERMKDHYPGKFVRIEIAETGDESREIHITGLDTVSVG